MLCTMKTLKTEWQNYYRIELNVRAAQSISQTSHQPEKNCVSLSLKLALCLPLYVYHMIHSFGVLSRQVCTGYTSWFMKLVLRKLGNGHSAKIVHSINLHHIVDKNILTLRIRVTLVHLYSYNLWHIDTPHWSPTHVTESCW